ncbi:hypothetical protein DF186_21115, partial [Enterococcus hirae]
MGPVVPRDAQLAPRQVPGRAARRALPTGAPVGAGPGAARPHGHRPPGRRWLRGVGPGGVGHRRVACRVGDGPRGAG